MTDDELSPEDERLVDDAVARMRQAHAADPAAYWEDRANRAEDAHADALRAWGLGLRDLGAARRDYADAVAERDRWRQAATDAAQHEDELAERLSLANAALARVLALADTWDAQAKAALAGDCLPAVVRLVDAQALRRALDGTQPDDDGGVFLAPPDA